MYRGAGGVQGKGVVRVGDSEFFTLRGYSLQEQRVLSDAMEDYLEMIYRQTRQEPFVRVNRLAKLLNVQPPSASKMAARLRDSGMVFSEPYGLIRLTPLGEEMGAYLLHRHRVLHRLLCAINGTTRELPLVEKIEHHFDRRTIENIQTFLEQCGMAAMDGEM